jgi:hypothetical protein
MVDLDALDSLFSLLRSHGAVSFRQGDLEVVLGPEPVFPDPLAAREDADELEKSLKDKPWRGLSPEDRALLGL